MYYTKIIQIRKRSGDIVDFDADKIFLAVSKAYQAVKGAKSEELVNIVTQSVVDNLNSSFGESLPSVEDVQNIVEKQLMAQGLFDVAKDYIIYRYEHTKEREEKKIETLEKAARSELKVKKRDGSLEEYNAEKVKKHLNHLIKGYEGVIDTEAVVRQLSMEMHDEISTKDLERALVMVLRSFIEQDPAYSFVAARGLILRMYKQVLGQDRINYENLDSQLKAHLRKSIEIGVAIGKLDPKMLLFDIDKLSQSLKIERDGNLTYLSAQTLFDRYFISDPVKKELIELPQLFWMRVAMGLALNEANKEEAAVNFYNVMSTLHFVPSTPTLFHAGTSHPQLSSCYLTTIEDSLDHIFKSISDNAQLSKWSGGIGNDWTKLRATGALIKGTGVESQGTIPFLKIANDTTVAINRSGKRRGATCAFMETWHYDIEDFLELRKNTGDERRRTHDMNTANWIPDLFIKRVKSDGMWTLFSPDETPDLHELYGSAFEKRYEAYEQKVELGEIKLFKRMPAKDLWRKMLTMLFETGHPWITFKDPCNLRSPQDHVGVVHNSNLCTEITLNTSAEETAVCNLGSVNLGRHVINGQLDMPMLEYTVTTAMRMLDNVIDLNFYPTKEAKNSNLKHRPVGLGLMGFHDALYKLGINFDSDAMVKFADESMEAISYFAIYSSSQLAKERGAYSTFRGSKWDRGLLPVDTIEILENERGTKIDVTRTGKLDWQPVRESIKQYGMRNSNTMAIAPTATISNIAGSIPSIEPIYKNIYVKSNQGGDFIIINEYLVNELKQLGLWNPQMLALIKYHDGNLSAIPDLPQEIKEKYKEVFQIDARWLIKAAAFRGKWIDQSQSLNIFYGGKSGKEINDIYLYAWEMGIKTTYYLRSLGVSQVEKSTVSVAEFGKTHIRDAFANSSQSQNQEASRISLHEVQKSSLQTTDSDSAPELKPQPETQAAVNTTEPLAAVTNNLMQPNSGLSSSYATLNSSQTKDRAHTIKVEAQLQNSAQNAMFAANAMAAVIPLSQKDFKACRLDDPTCEACQ